MTEVRTQSVTDEKGTRNIVEVIVRLEEADAHALAAHARARGSSPIHAGPAKVAGQPVARALVAHGYGRGA